MIETSLFNVQNITCPSNTIDYFDFTSILYKVFMYVIFFLSITISDLLKRMIFFIGFGMPLSHLCFLILSLCVCFSIYECNWLNNNNNWNKELSCRNFLIYFTCRVHVPKSTFRFKGSYQEVYPLFLFIFGYFVLAAKKFRCHEFDPGFTCINCGMQELEKCTYWSLFFFFF